MSEYIQPFNLQQIFINIFAGNPDLFTFLAIIIVSGALAYFRVPDKVYMPMLALFAVFFAAWIGSALYVITILLVGLITFKSIAKIVT